MKRYFAFFVLFLLTFIPIHSSAVQEILISEAAGTLTIPDGFYEIPSDTENERVFYNADGERILVNVFYLKDIFPIVYEVNLQNGKPDEPLYANGGELSAMLGHFYEAYKESMPELEISFTNRGYCAAIECECENFVMVTVINRYEVVSVSAVYKDAYSPTSFIPFMFEPIEQSLH